MPEGKIKVLFVCTENAGRSQIAEAFAKKIGGNKIEALSAGSNPSSAINPVVVMAMKEVDIDISANTPKGFNKLPYSEFDYMVTMGCSGTCPIFPSKQIFNWDIEDPKGKNIEAVRKIRDTIKTKVEDLLQTIHKTSEN